ncbi:protein kinase domain-containing protein [Marisediminicola sp. LYQ85]|uniref:serine/threonine-protein kinase n=1 Tax=Marisediminicola sp. LYQ85 TaxID=3391062 RepID=UPI0039835041
MRRPASQPPALPGYTFVSVLGSGGFSDVYLYEQQLPKRRVAVKVLLADEISGADRAAFVGEANLMAQLSTHPYIVSIYHADVASDDRPYFVMEYCSGPSLAERYKQQTFAVADALRTGVRLSSAIATAHSAGILHRDIKPANVLTNDYGWPALTDFGISSAVEDDSLQAHTGTLSELIDESGATGTGSIGMSVPWSPPEMFEDDPKPDVRSDVFSLAATIYTIIAGQTPFEVRGRSNGTLDLIGRIERGAVTPISRTDVPRSLVAVLQKGMATDRAQRFESAIDFARALQRVELELGYSPTPIDVPNLDVVADERVDGGDDPDATRARSVATIEAQPKAPLTPGDSPAPVIPPPSADAAETVARRSTSIEAQPSTPAPDETVVRPRTRETTGRASTQSASTNAASTQGALTYDTSTDAAATGAAATSGSVADETVVRPARTERTAADPPAAAVGAAGEASAAEAPAGSGDAVASRPRSLTAWIAGAAAAAIAIAVVVSLVVFGPPAGPDTATSPSAPAGGPAVLDTIPAPELEGAEDEGDSLVFTVSNPDAEEGDTIRWARLPQVSTDPPRTTDDGVITIDPWAGERVCIEASIIRDGRSSANPLEACYPE